MFLVSSLIEYGRYRFLIMDAPTDANLSAYIDILKKKKVVAVVRACEPTYAKQPLEEAGMKVTELNFPDGDPVKKRQLTKTLQSPTTCVRNDTRHSTYTYTTTYIGLIRTLFPSSSSPSHIDFVDAACLLYFCICVVSLLLGFWLNG